MTITEEVLNGQGLNKIHFVPTEEIINSTYWLPADWDGLYPYRHNSMCTINELGYHFNCSNVSYRMRWIDCLELCRSDDRYDVIYQSLKYNGYLAPLTARIGQQHIALFDGHHRFAASLDLDIPKVPIFIADADKTIFDLVAIDSNCWTRIEQVVDTAQCAC